MQAPARHKNNDVLALRLAMAVANFFDKDAIAHLQVGTIASEGIKRASKRVDRMERMEMGAAMRKQTSKAQISKIDR